MENCLVKVARALNEAQIRWALGASMLLYFKELVPRANDIDLVIALEHVGLAEATLKELGRKEAPNPHNDFATRYFAEFVMDGFDVDVMAGFRIIAGDTIIEYVPDPKTFETLVMQDTTIHLCPLEDWYVLNLLMPNREGRVATIKEYLLRNGTDHTILKTWLDKPLPQAVSSQIYGLLQGTTHKC